MKRRLIIHVGMGKTGSTSIQMSLRSNEDLLEKMGVKYLGLMLENVNLPKEYSWQHSGGWHTLLRLGNEKSTEELVEAFAYVNDTLSSAISTLIWSNESLFFDFEQVNAVKILEKIYDIHVIGYIRRPDDWISSAYLQWGVKHKTYTGPLQSFRQWSKVLPYTVAPRIDFWKSLFDRSDFFNFNAVGDVTRHFLEKSIPASSHEIEVQRSNDTPPPAGDGSFLRI